MNENTNTSEPSINPTPSPESSGDSQTQEPTVIDGQWKDVDEPIDTNQTPPGPTVVSNAGNTESTESVDQNSQEEGDTTSTNTEAISYPSSPKKSVTNVVRNEGTDKVSLNADENSNSYRASSDYNKFSPEHTFTPDTPTHNRSKQKDTWSIKKGEKPTEIIENSDYSINRTRSEKDERSKSLKDLDEVDQHGMRVGYRSSFQTAERIKVLDNIKEYDKQLRNGRELTEKEKDLLLETELSKVKAYQDEKKYYELKKLPQEDIDLLLNNHFEDEINTILEGFKNSNGEFNSTELNIDQLVLLKEAYKKSIVKEFAEDRMARMDESDERFRKKRENDYLEENPNWTPETARKDQRVRLAEEKVGLYREQMLQNKQNGNEGDENEDSTIPNPTPKEIEPEEAEDTEAQERKIKRIALIAGVVAGSTTTILGGAAVLPAAGGIAVGGGLLSTGTEALSNWRIKKLNEKLSTTEDPTEKVQIEKRLANWNKVRKIASTARGFFTAGAIGVTAGGLFNHFVMGGEGLISKLTPDKTGNLGKTPEVTSKSKNPQSVTNTPSQQGINPKPEVTQPGVTAQPEMTQINALDPNNLPDTLPLDDYPLFKQGLGERANYSQQQIDQLKTLFIGEGTPGGDWWTQRRTVEEILKNGLSLNSEAAGKTVAHIAGNKLPVTSENVIKIYNSFLGN